MLSSAPRGSRLRILANAYPSFGLPGTRVLPNHLGAKGMPIAFLRMTCAPIGAPHTLPEDRRSQEEATRQGWGSLGSSDPSVCMQWGESGCEKPRTPPLCTYTTHTRARVHTSIPTSKRKVLKASGLEKITHGTPRQCPRGAATYSLQTRGQALSQVLSQKQEQNTAKLQRL